LWLTVKQLVADASVMCGEVGQAEPVSAIVFMAELLPYAILRVIEAGHLPHRLGAAQRSKPESAATRNGWKAALVPA